MGNGEIDAPFVLKAIIKILKSHYPEATVPQAIAYIEFILGLPAENERDLKAAIEIVIRGQ